MIEYGTLRKWLQYISLIHKTSSVKITLCDPEMLLGQLLHIKTVMYKFYKAYEPLFYH